MPIAWDYWNSLARGYLGELQQTPAPSEAHPTPPMVTVFGAGISGLSAAHELIDRGFGVQVVEPTESTMYEYECQVGGMAANQLSRVNAGFDELHEQLLESDPNNNLATLRLLRSVEMRPTQPRFPITHRIQFERGDTKTSWLLRMDRHGVTNESKLHNVLELLHQAHEVYGKDYETRVQELAAVPFAALDDGVRHREILLVQILGFTDTDSTPDQNRQDSSNWAKWVMKTMLDFNKTSPFEIADLEKHVESAGLGDTDPIGDQRVPDNRSNSNRVEFRIVEQVMPGEHGFRFFPAFYRHLFDTMQKTPILDNHGQETGKSAFDQLVATPESQLARAEDKKAPLDINLRHNQSLRDIQKLLTVLMTNIGITGRDMLRLQVPLIKYLTCARERRDADCEDINFWDYIGGSAAGYSQNAREFIEKTPKALAAMSATETDARTQCTILIQMLLRKPLDTLIDDMTLNGSSTEAWLRVWKNYLRQKGVRFFVGSIDAIAKQTDGESADHFRPVVKGPGDWLYPRAEDPNHRFVDFRDDDFVVLALSFEAVSKLLWETYWKTIDELVASNGFTSFEAMPAVDKDRIGKEAKTLFIGPLIQLLNFDLATERVDSDGKWKERERDPVTGKPSNPKDPLRDINGIQYFLPNNYRFGRGNVYYTDSPWALTSISQLAYWRDRTHPIGNFIGQNSVDIGDWYSNYPESGVGQTAWRSTKQYIANATWRQVEEGLDQRYAESILPPQYYHLDDGIVFGESLTLGYLGNTTITVNEAKANSVYEIRARSGERSKEFAIEVSAGQSKSDVAKNIAKKLNEADDDRLFFCVPQGPRALVSPVVMEKTVIVYVRGVSAHRYFCRIGSTVHAVQGDREISTVAKELRDLNWSAETVDIEPWGHAGFRVKTTDPNHAPVPVSVLNEDDMIEVLDGPSLEIHVANRDVSVLRRPYRSSNRVLRRNVRGRLKINFTEPVPGVTYTVSLQVHGESKVTASWTAERDDTLEDVRDKITAELVNLADDWFNFRIDPSSVPDDEMLIDPKPSIQANPSYLIETTNIDLVDAGVETPLKNGWNFLINVPCQWRYRPGLYRRPASAESIMLEPGARAEFKYWHDKGSPFAQWVLAGTYMATHTRMTTMEAANESARHAVNAILHRYKADSAAGGNQKGTLIGEPCEIWDPEEFEPSDLEYFKELDAALHAENLPHFLDILKVEDIVGSLPDTEGQGVPTIDELQSLITQSNAILLGEASIGSDAVDSIVDNIAKIVEMLLPGDNRL